MWGMPEEKKLESPPAPLLSSSSLSISPPLDSIDYQNIEENSFVPIPASYLENGEIKDTAKDLSIQRNLISCLRFVQVATYLILILATVAIINILDAWMMIGKKITSVVIRVVLATIQFYSNCFCHVRDFYLMRFW